ncbi:unnamed protein product [Soboliphyme baturini]|uniref:Ig-like domain-containing protein n=1 Tax=Soboliphyme baturini TaxID=241478 RepID=A0A183I8T8_9BILA|nr:unnamed protein product [Soboliphyme baturini]
MTYGDQHVLIGGVPLGNLSDKRISVHKNKFVLKNLQPADEGTYTCVASNSEGRVTYDIQLHYSKGAYFDTPLQNITVVEGSTLIWPCQAKAVPMNLRYRWLFQEKELQYGDTTLPFRSNVQGGTLKIFPVLKEDQGWFTCEANNGHDSIATSRAFLNVHYSATVLSKTPSIQFIPKSISSFLYCLIDANPPLKFVIWTKDGQIVNTDTGKRTNVFLSDNGLKLHFRKGTMKDGGIYSCQAYNAIGASNAFEIHGIVAGMQASTEEQK